MEVSKFHRKSMPVEHARNLFKLWEALQKGSHDDSPSEAEDLGDEAEIYLKRRKPNVVACDTDGGRIRQPDSDLLEVNQIMRGRICFVRMEWISRRIGTGK